MKEVKEGTYVRCIDDDLEYESSENIRIKLGMFYKITRIDVYTEEDGEYKNVIQCFLHFEGINDCSYQSEYFEVAEVFLIEASNNEKISKFDLLDIEDE